jgi:hypothetical protein
MKNREAVKCLLLATVLGTMVLAMTPAAASAAELPVNLSGYEFFLGFDCTIDETPARCGVLFGGWTGGDGAVAGGWVGYPGTGKGFWSANVDYVGAAGFTNTATLVGGNFSVAFKNRKVVTGAVTGGSVTWLADRFSDTSNPDCGPGVAQIIANLTISDVGPGTFTACEPYVIRQRRESGTNDLLTE